MKGLRFELRPADKDQAAPAQILKTNGFRDLQDLDANIPEQGLEQDHSRNVVHYPHDHQVCNMRQNVFRTWCQVPAPRLRAASMNTCCLMLSTDAYNSLARLTQLARA